MEYPILKSLVIVFFLVLVVSVLFRYIRLPIIFGYLVIGALVGPHTLAWLPDLEHLHLLSGFGVVFLMFTVGLEFSLPKMIALRKEVFLLGGLQVGITITISLLITEFVGMELVTSLVIAGALAMSSTAIVAKQLTDQGEAYEPHGKNAIGILLFQDFAVIPLLIIITSLAKHQPNITDALLLAVAKGVIVILVILLSGQWLFRAIFHIIAKTHLIELFTLAALLTLLGTAWLTYAMGLSFALGAFTAGMILGATPFRHQIEAEIRPFRDVLLGLFFITNGAILNMTTWKDTWPWIALLLLALLIGKSIIVTLLCTIFNKNKINAVRTGIVLAQGGEFGFALLAVAFNLNLLAVHDGQVLLSALLLSIALSPILINHNEKIAHWLLFFKRDPTDTHHRESLSEQAAHIKDHVIICGYGVIGQNVGNLLEERHIPYIVLDLDPDRIHEASMIGKPIFYGDATQIELLNAAGLLHAKALVISFDDTALAKKILEQVHNHKPLLPTLVRCKNEVELTQLKDAGATQLIVANHEESLMLTYCVLLALDIKRIDASEFIRNVREKHYALLEQVFIDTYPIDAAEEALVMKQLHSIVLLDNTYAVGHTLHDMKLEKLNITVVALRRNKAYHHNPRPTLKLHANDVLLLYGFPENIDKAEEILLKPRKSWFR